MYRIKLANGDEVVYRTAEQLSTAVASGLVSPTSEVFHNSGSRWLPINLHPDYRALTSGQRLAVGLPAPLAAAEAGQAPAMVVARILNVPKKFSRSVRSPTPTISEAAATPLAPIAHVVPDLVVAGPEPGSVLPVEPAARESGVASASDGAAAVVPVTMVGGYDSRARKLRIMLALTMSLAGVISLGGAAIMATPFLKRTLASAQRALRRTEGMDPRPVEALVPRVDSGLGLFPAPSAPYPMAAGVRLDSLIASRPRTTTTQLRASRPRSLSYSEAYAEARDEMDSGLDYIDFRRVFAGYRFESADSIRAGRRMVSAAGNILRVYRGREVMLEQSYRPDDPGGHGSLRESFETAEASRALISDVDSLLGLLVAQQGRFTWTDSGLRFQEARTAASYMRLRSDILRSLAIWRDSVPAPNRSTYPRLMAGLGQPGPPPAH